jgi:MoaA/NifB/PqqE/SkfB family radical SAM enzyme
MTRRIWKASLQLSTDYDSSIAIGGGEPTLHPHFWEIMGTAMGMITGDGYVWLATNGSQTNTAIALANLAKKGVIGCALSQDEWHDPIDPEVIQAFTSDKRHYDDRTPDAREIRRTQLPFKAGRCKDGDEGCVCPDLFITPNGTLKGCGCHKAQVFGTVFDPKIPDNFEMGECSVA